MTTRRQHLSIKNIGEENRGMNKNLLIALLILFVFVSCKNKYDRDISDQVSFGNEIVSNDSLLITIKEIYLHNTFQSKRKHKLPGELGIELSIKFKNKFNKNSLNSLEKKINQFKKILKHNKFKI